MNKLLVYGLTATLAVSSSSLVYASDAYEVNYGFNISSAEENVSEDITIYTTGDNAIGSMSVSSDVEGETIDIDLPNYVKVVDNTVYLNTDVIASAVAALSDMTDIKSYARLIGITEDWMEIPPIDLSAIKIDLSQGEFVLPEIDESISDDFIAIFENMITEDTESDSFAYIINNDTLLQSADAFDTFKNKHLGFVSDYLVYLQDILTNVSSVDVKPAIRNYLDAAARGIMNSDSTITEEQAKQLVDGIVDNYVAQGISILSEAVSEIPIADLWNNATVASVMTEALAGSEFELRITPSETGIKLALTVDGATVTSDVSLTDSGLHAELFDVEGNIAGSLDIAFDISSVSLVVNDASNAEVVSMKGTYSLEDEQISVAFDMESSYTEEISMHGYFNVLDWEDDGSLTAPEASCNLLDVVETTIPFLLMTSDTPVE